MATEAKTTIHSLLVPMWTTPLLLPDTAMAEVVGFTVPESERNAPWHLGDIFWRGLRLPLITLEAAMPTVEEIGKRARIGILNSATGNEDIPFMAILINGIPRLQNVGPDDLSPAENASEMAEPPRGIAGYARLSETVVALPDMKELEAMSLEAMG